MPRGHDQTVKEVAESLQVGEVTVRCWIRDGGLRAIDGDKGWRVADNDLQGFLSRHATRARRATDESTGHGTDAAPGHSRKA